jgi:hypothetical protein
MSALKRASDFEDTSSLIAVSASANRSKGDQGAEEWLPPEPSYHCRMRPTGWP